MKTAVIFRWFFVFTLIFSTMANAQDWPEINRYTKANEALGDPAPGENRVVFIGNSITEGWGHHHPEYFARPDYINRGIGGQTTPQMLLRFRSDVIHLKPEVVVILAGTNDIAGNTGPMTLEQIRDNIISMSELARANDIAVVISSVLPAFEYTWRPGLEPNVKIPKLNGMLKAYAEKEGFVYLDYFSAMTDGRNGMPEIYSEDGVHPNKQGYLAMEPLAEKAIQQALKR